VRTPASDGVKTAKVGDKGETSSHHQSALGIDVARNNPGEGSKETCWRKGVEDLTSGVGKTSRRTPPRDHGAEKNAGFLATSSLQTKSGGKRDITKPGKESRLQEPNKARGGAAANRFKKKKVKARLV